MLHGVLEEHQLGLLGEDAVVVVQVVLENRPDPLHVRQVLVHAVLFLRTHLTTQAHAHTHAHTHTHTHKERHARTHADKHTHRHTDRHSETDRQIDGDRHRHTQDEEEVEEKVTKVLDFSVVFETVARLRSVP